LLLPKK